MSKTTFRRKGKAHLCQSSTLLVFQLHFDGLQLFGAFDLFRRMSFDASQLSLNELSTFLPSIGCVSLSLEALSFYRWFPVGSVEYLQSREWRGMSEDLSDWRFFSRANSSISTSRLANSEAKYFRSASLSSRALPNSWRILFSCCWRISNSCLSHANRAWGSRRAKKI